MPNGRVHFEQEKIKKFGSYLASIMEYLSGKKTQWSNGWGQGFWKERRRSRLEGKRWIKYSGGETAREERLRENQKIKK